MASLFTAGWEAGDQSEWDGTFGTTPAVSVNSAYNSSNYGMALDDASTTGLQLKDINGSGVAVDWYIRFYLRINESVDAEEGILFVQVGGSGADTACRLTLSSDDKLRIYSNYSTAVGSASSALSTGVWYRVEVHVDITQTNGSRIVEARLNGSSFASSSSETIDDNTGGRLSVGEVSTHGTHDFDIDTLEVDDATWPAPVGEGGTGRTTASSRNAAGARNLASSRNVASSRNSV